MSKNETKVHPASPNSTNSAPASRPDLSVESVLSKASSAASEFMNSDAKAQIEDLTSEWAKEATKFIKRNPWAAVLGAAAIGYYLGASRNRGGGR